MKTLSYFDHLSKLNGDTPLDVVEIRCSGCGMTDEQCLYCAVAQARRTEREPGYCVEETRELTDAEWLRFRAIMKGLE
jgi:hypothetical protein